MEAFNGRISLISKLGKGTLIKFDFEMEDEIEPEGNDCDIHDLDSEDEDLVDESEEEKDSQEEGVNC